MNTADKNTPFTQEELAYEISHREEKLLDRKETLDNLQISLKKDEEENNGKEAFNLKRSLDVLTAQFEEAETELVELLKQYPPTNAGPDTTPPSEKALRATIAANIEALKQREADIVEAKVAEAHEILGDSEAYKILLAVTRFEEKSDEAILKLRKLNDPRVIEALLRFLEIRGFWGYWASTAFMRLSDKEKLLPVLLPYLEHASPVVRAHAITAVEYLERTPQYANPRTAFELLGFIVTHQPKDDRIVNALLGKLKDNHPTVRASAVSALCHLGDQRAALELIATLEDPAKEVRGMAASRLGSFGDERAIEPLVKLLHCGDKDLEGWAKSSLMWLGYEEVEKSVAAELFKAFGAKDQAQAEELVEKFADLKKQDDEEGMGQLMRGLLNQRLAPEGATGLITQLKSRDTGVRSDAATRLGVLGDIAAVEPLIERLSEPDPLVRDKVIFALGMLGDQRAVEPLLTALSQPENPDDHAAIVRALGSLGDTRVVPPLLALLQEESIFEDLRQTIIYALERLGDKQAYQPILKLVKETQNKTTRATGLSALGKLGDSADTREETLQILRDKLKNGDLEERIAATEGLIQVGDQRDLPDLEEILEIDSNEPGVQYLQEVTAEAIHHIKVHRESPDN